MEEGVVVVFSVVFEAIAQLLMGLLELLFLAISLVFQLVEVLVWLVWSRFDKNRTRPQRRKFGGPRWMKNRETTTWARLAVVVLIAAAGAGMIIHEHKFKAKVRFVSTNGNGAHHLEYEWVKKNGKSKAGETAFFSGEEYTTYRWHEIRVTDDRYEPQTVTLTKKDQVIELVPSAKQNIKEKAISATGAVAGKALGTLLDHFAEKKAKEDSAGEGEKE